MTTICNGPRQKFNCDSDKNTGQFTNILWWVGLITRQTIQFFFKYSFKNKNNIYMRRTV